MVFGRLLTVKLGDTSESFFRLGQQFSLPATCVLSLQGNVP